VLNSLLDDADVQIIAVDAPEDFAAQHIPGAHQLAQADFTASAGATRGLLPDDAALAATLSAAGLRNSAHIVAYDRAGDAQAARLLYTLDAAGHEGFSLLDGGLAAWRAAGLPLESGASAQQAGAFRVARRTRVIADRAWIAAHQDDADVRLLDVRSDAEFSGHDVRAARAGHIPGATNLDWREFKDAAGRLRDPAELRRLLAEHGIDASNEVAAYCQSHGRSSYAYLVLKALGYTRIRGYPGAWSEWGNAADTPVESNP
jgi:thiosulfate/3-mercaptopyruvate sulfurtransferase